MSDRTVTVNATVTVHRTATDTGDDRCRDAHLMHCHGTWVIHPDGSQECTDLTCITPVEAHEFIAYAEDLG